LLDKEETIFCQSSSSVILSSLIQYGHIHFLPLGPDESPAHVVFGLETGVLRCVVRFLENFLINWQIYGFLIKKAELPPVASKKMAATDIPSRVPSIRGVG
jgi:hypothetical protein